MFYNTRSSQIGGEHLGTTVFSSVHKSTKQFGFSFACDAQKVQSEFSDDIRSATSLLFIRSNRKLISSQKPTHHRCYGILQLSLMLTPLLCLWTKNCLNSLLVVAP